MKTVLSCVDIGCQFPTKKECPHMYHFDLVSQVVSASDSHADSPRIESHRRQTKFAELWILIYGACWVRMSTAIKPGEGWPLHIALWHRMPFVCALYTARYTSVVPPLWGRNTDNRVNCTSHPAQTLPNLNPRVKGQLKKKKKTSPFSPSPKRQKKIWNSLSFLTFKRISCVYAKFERISMKKSGVFDSRNRWKRQE